MDPNVTSVSPLPTWQAEHKIKKHFYNPLRDPCLGMKIKFVALALISIPFVPILVLVKFGLYLRERHITKWSPKHPLNSIREMKATEELDKFQTMQKVWTEFNCTNTSSINKATEWTNQLEDKLKNFDPRNKVVHYLLRELNKKGPIAPVVIRRLTDIVKGNSFANRSLSELKLEIQKRILFDQKFDDFEAAWQRIEKKVNEKLVTNEKQKGELQKFQTSLEQLLKTLEKDSNVKDFDATAANRAFIAHFREILGTSIYRQFKEDSSVEAIHFLHRLAADTWNKAPSMAAYMKVGENIAEQTHTAVQASEELSGPIVAEKLKKSHDEMKKLHYPAQGLLPMFTYAVSHIEQTIGGLASEGMVPGLQYDSHGTLSNNPSLQGITKMKFYGEEVSVHNCYGGSPTIGNHRVAPEFKALLQAAENNQLLSDDKRDPQIPCLINYHNFQNLDHAHGEGERSRLIMLLQLRYPLSFRGITLAKDSKLYQMHHESDVVWQNAKQFEAVMLAQMNRSFDPKEKGHGFYFPGSKEEWQPVFKAILDEATEQFQIIEGDLTNPNDINMRRDLQGAYQEFVYAMIKAHSEVHSMRLLRDRDVRKNVLVSLINACKENIDRGGMANTLYLYLRIMLNTKLNAKEKQALLTGAMHCRAISSRDRLILASRMPQGLSFIKYVDAKQFDLRCKQMFSNLKHNVEDQQYSPHLPRKTLTIS